jgi:hypothetical protein
MAIKWIMPTGRERARKREQGFESNGELWEWG